MIKRYAKDCKCCVKGCKEKAVEFFPVCDPDIPSYPYCRKHLDEAEFRLFERIEKMCNKR